MNIILGMIAQHLNHAEPLIDFLKNAEHFGHKISRVILSVSETADVGAIRAIENFVPLELIYVNIKGALYRDLLEAGVAGHDVETLLYSPDFEQFRKISYGQKRNQVILAAIRSGGDVLVFVDTDVYPTCLRGNPESQTFEDIDFFGRHLEGLAQEGVGITTSDYSGYYIIPPMNFPKLDQFLEGLQKESAIEFLWNSSKTHSLTFDAGEMRSVFKSNKILGGNTALNLSIFNDCLPFFSSVYHFEGNCYMTRGEDTLMGREIAKSDKWTILDIDTRIFHDTFGTFPEIPDMKTQPWIRDRFFNTCMGWIGRNPIINTLTGEDSKKLSQHQTECLEASAKEVATYLEDARFLKLPDAARAAYAQLPETLFRFDALKESWPRAIACLMSQRL